METFAKLIFPSFINKYCCPLNYKSLRFPYPQRPSIGVAGFFLEKQAPLPDHHSSAVRQKRENGRHEMGANVYFKPLRDSEFGKVY